MTVPPEPRDDQPHIPAQPNPDPAIWAATEPVSPPRRKWPWIAGAAAAVVVLGGAAVWLAVPSDAGEAVERCQTAIRDKLRSPSTAVFVDDVTQDNSESVFRIYGQLDAQNGFGATVRSDYRCVLRLEDDGSWVTTEATVTTR